MQFQNQKVFITGASRGIGAAIAKAFMDAGAHVIGTKTSSDEIKGGHCNEWVVANFLNNEGLEYCSELVRLHKPEILINNAGINKIDSFLNISAVDFLNIQQVNLVAPFTLCQAALPSMIQNTYGRIVNIASIWSKISKAYRASYSASKFGLDGMTLAIAAEFASSGIVANSISPGFIDTELTRRILSEGELNVVKSAIPSGRLGSADEIAQLVLWLASPSNTYVSGQNIAIDGGFSRV